MKKFAFTLVVLLSSACGSNGPVSTGSGSASGNVEGVYFTVNDATFAEGPGGTAIVLSTVVGICADLQAAKANSNAPGPTTGQLLEVTIGQSVSAQTTYTMSSGQISSAMYGMASAATPYYATDGSIVIASADANEVTGTYTLAFANNSNGTLSGTFTAGVCHM